LNILNTFGSRVSSLQEFRMKFHISEVSLHISKVTLHGSRMSLHNSKEVLYSSRTGLKDEPSWTLRWPGKVPPPLVATRSLIGWNL
jgi:hypothetical protein